MKILILCTGNSCRSQIMHGYLKQNESNEVYSAGIETHGVNPKAIQVMQEDQIDISGHTSNNIEEYLDIEFDLILTVCDHAKETCPHFPSSSRQLHFSFPDPAKAKGTEEEIMHSFREVRDQIKFYAQNLDQIIDEEE